MGDMGDDFRAWKQASIEKRASNRKHGAEALTARGIAFDVRNDGAHLIVRHAGKVIDYWPGTGKWKVHNGKYGRGIHQLLKTLTPS